MFLHRLLYFWMCVRERLCNVFGSCISGRVCETDCAIYLAPCVSELFYEKVRAWFFDISKMYSKDHLGKEYNVLKL